MGGQDLALKHCSEEVGLPSHQLQGAHECAEKLRGQSPKMSVERHFWWQNKAGSPLLCHHGEKLCPIGEALSPGKPRVMLQQGIPHWKERQLTFASAPPRGAPPLSVLPGQGRGL